MRNDQANYSRINRYGASVVLWQCPGMIEAPSPTLGGRRDWLRRKALSSKL